MANNVRKELELYAPMRLWLQRHLEDKYTGHKVVTVDSHAQTLDVFLAEFGLADIYPQIVGLDIQIDVLGVVFDGRRPKLAFIEAKKTQLNLHDLGQLWAYCRLCDPEEAFLLSSVGIGSLDKILRNLRRTDLLDFGDGSYVKAMQVGKWDLSRNAVDFGSLIPKL